MYYSSRDAPRMQNDHIFKLEQNIMDSEDRMLDLEEKVHFLSQAMEDKRREEQMISFPKCVRELRNGE